MMCYYSSTDVVRFRTFLLNTSWRHLIFLFSPFSFFLFSLFFFFLFSLFLFFSVFSLLFFSLSSRGLYSPLFRGKPPEKKLLLLADFIKKLGPLYKKLNFGNLYRPKSQKVRKCQMQSHIKDLCFNPFIVPQLLK